MNKRRPIPLVSAAIAVIERRGRYLVNRRRAQAHLGGLWEFPGGKRRPGESWQACVRREGYEEIGAEISVIRRLPPLRFAYSDRRVRLEVFRCRIIKGRPAPLRTRAIRWVSLTELVRLPFPEANRPLVRRLSRRGS